MTTVSMRQLWERVKARIAVKEGGEEDVSNEEILNVFRRLDEDERVLKTPEVAEELSIGSKQTKTRLDTLADEGRVNMRDLDPSHIWWLDKDEPTIPVRTGANTPVWFSAHLRRFGRNALYLGGILGLFTSIMYVVYYLIGQFSPLAMVLTKDQASLGGGLTAVFAAEALFLGGVCLLGARLLMRQSQIDS